ncbi:Nuclease harbi1 [Temnothorax longispinosus]|uniref:Nuclease harbi1 n=1 Tax=Temnothorax longispinosus TaxID=300112 RepID=A0A4S2JMP9_9HYME|nr:Nuclease harbi1 [Temnothorax longispinosus]
MAIEQAFGLLKICFRILLDCLPLLGIKHIPEFIIACCVLHNNYISKCDLMDVQVPMCNESIQTFYENNSMLGCNRTCGLELM